MSDLEELCEWLRMNSSGYYSQSSDAADVIESMQQQIIRLRAEAEDRNKMINKFLFYAGSDQRDFYFRHFDFNFESPENEIKAQGIEEMAGAIKINDASELDDPYCGGSGYDQALAAATAYADNLRNKEGE